MRSKLGGEDSGSDFEEEYKKNYVKSQGAVPGSSRIKRNEKMTISQIMAEELNLSESSSSDDEDILNTSNVSRTNKISCPIGQTTKTSIATNSLGHKCDENYTKLGITNINEDLEMASQLENLAKSYNKIFDQAKKSQKGSENITPLKTVKKLTKKEEEDVNTILSLGEGVDVPNIYSKYKNDNNRLGEESQTEKNIEIKLEDTGNNIGLRRKKGLDAEAYVKREFSRVQREFQIILHKVSFLGLVAHLRKMNRYLGATGSSEEGSKLLLAMGLSVVPAAHATKSEQLTIVRLGSFVSWFRDAFPVVDSADINHDEATEHVMENLFDESPERVLQRAFENYVCQRREHLVFIFILAARALGWNTRLVMNMDTISVKPEKEVLNSQTKVHDSKAIDNEDGCEVPKSNLKLLCDAKSGNIDNSNGKQCSRISKNKMKRTISKSFNIPQLDGANDGTKNVLSKKRCQGIGGPSKQKPNRNASCSQPDEAYKEKCKSVAAAVKKARENRKKKYLNTMPKDGHRSQSKIKLSKQTANCDMHAKRANANSSKRKTAKKKFKLSEKGLMEAASRRRSASLGPIKHLNQVGSDTDTEELSASIQTSSNLSIKKRLKHTNKSTKNKGKQRQNPYQYWAEVYINSKWVTVDVIGGRVDCPNAMEQKLYGRINKYNKRYDIEKPSLRQMLYAVAGNIDGSLKDVTKRYTLQTYMTTTRKARAPVEEWIKRTLNLFKVSPTSTLAQIEIEEDKYLEKSLCSCPMPKTIGAFKNHPLYVLRRDLLKNESIYPSDAPTMGFIQGQAIYARECVQTLQSRVAWLKEGLVVRLGEEPYKIVTAKSKLDRMSGQILTDQPMELFGKWQTEKYIPPPAENGKVPRNEYGNVELFRPWMLPKGTVHIPIQGR